MRLKEALNAKKIDIKWINPAIVWANSDASLKVENSTVPVWTMDHLENELHNLSSKYELSDEQYQQVIDALSEIVQTN